MNSSPPTKSLRINLRLRSQVMRSPPTSPSHQPATAAQPPPPSHPPPWRKKQGEEEAKEADGPPPPPPPPMGYRPTNQPTVLGDGVEIAVERLAEMIRIKGREGLLDDSVDPKELLADISNQMSRLEEDDGARFDYDENNNEHTDEEDWMGSNSNGDNNSRFHRDHRPTPFDMWSGKQRGGSAARRSSSSSSSKKVLSEEQWENLVERLHDSLRQHHAQVAATQQAIQAAQLTEATFTPKINERSRQIAGTNELSLVERTSISKAQRSAKLEQERKRLEEKELREATFHPKINANSKEISSRLFDNPFERRIEAARKAQVEREIEERTQHTFSPMINEKSKRLASRGKALHLAFSPSVGMRNDLNASRHEEETFHPSINDNSRRIASLVLAEDKPAYERLYERGVEATRRTKERELLMSNKKLSAKAQHQQQGQSASVVMFKPEKMAFILETLEKNLH